MFRYLVILLLSLITLNLAAQEDEDDYAPAPEAQQKKKDKPPAWKLNRWYTGGNVGVAFGNNYTYLQLAPLIGYKLTEKYSVGAGINLSYYYNSVYAQSLMIYGGRVFNRYIVTDNLFLHGEFLELNFPTYDITGQLKRQFYPRMFLGAGYTTSVGGGVSLYALFLYDVLWRRTNSAFSTPLDIRAGIGIGF